MMYKNTVIVFFIALILSACNGAGSTSTNTDSSRSKSEIKLGTALQKDIPDTNTQTATNTFDSSKKVPASNTGGWSIDTSNRQLVRSFYNSVFLASESTPMEWTGDQDTCAPGTTSSDYKNSVLARVNYFRAMTGIPANITLNSTYNTKAQQSALMMSANNTLSHTPPNTWNCYTADGAQAASSSNLSLGRSGWDAVSGQMRDNGSNNTLVGHRRWILYPQTQQMGTGDVAANASYSEANDLWVFDGNFGTTRPTTRDDFVAFPTKGYNPYQIVPIRWSFSYLNAQFNNATVTMTQGATTIPVTIDDQSATGYGENTIVWHPTSMSTSYGERWPKPANDTDYQITISNIVLNGVLTSYNYTVTVIDPQTATIGEETTSITGSATPPVNTPSTYNFNNLTISNNYDAIIAEIDSNLTNYDAEDNGVNVTDKTDASYTLIYSGSGDNGTSVYRLAPATDEEIIEFPETYIPSTNGSISFDSKLGYATTGQTAAFQISTDDGASWADIYILTGSGQGSPEETSFSTHTISLTAYADKFVKFRAIYSHTGSRYLGTTANVSFLLDNIQLNNATQLVSATNINDISTASFSVTPQADREYALAVRAVPWAGYPALQWGEILYLNPVQFSSGESNVVNRAEAAKIILLAKYGAGFTPDMETGLEFDDVNIGEFNASWIERLAADEITEGCTATNYCPNTALSKDQLAKLVLKAKFGSAYTPLAATGSVYDDVNTSTFAASWIEALEDEGFTEGCTANNYCPSELVTYEVLDKVLNATFP